MLSDIQEDFFLNSYHSWNLCCGSVSSGKTHIWRIRLYEHFYTLPDNCFFVLVGRTGEALYTNAIKNILELDTIGDFEYHRQPQKIIIKSKNIEIICIGADNQESWKRIQGITSAGAGFDELTNLAQSLVQTVAKGCRFQGKIWSKFATTNPDYPGHWVKTDLMDNEKLDIKTWNFILTDNPALTDEYREEIKNTYTGAMYDRMILGRWTIATGAIYENFSRSVHIKSDKDLPKFKEYVCGVDWGYEHPLAITLFGIDYDGNYWIIDEIYTRHQLIDDSLKLLMAKKGWFNLPIGIQEVKPSFAYCDSARPEYINTFTRLTGISALPANKEVHEGIGLVQSKLKMKKNGECGLYVLDKCKNTINEFESYRWAVSKENTKDEPVKLGDDLMDSIRYCIYTREKSSARVIRNNPFKGFDPFGDWDDMVFR